MKLRNKITGEIIEDVKYIDTSLTTIEINYLDDGILRIHTEKDYHTFLQNWEDYDKPIEPLIKNEKIRKAVRAWAEANEIETVEYDEYWVSFRRDDKTISFKDEDSCLGFYGLKNSRDYAIAELCGEDEE